MRLRTTKRQDETLNRLLEQLCELYNMALQQRRNAYKECGVSIYLYNQMLQLTELRNGIEEYGQGPLMIQRDPLRRLDKAFRGFFRRIKAGEKPGFPRFRSRYTYNSFTVPKGEFSLGKDSITLPKMGTLRTKTKCNIKGIPLELRVKHCGSKWQAQVVCDLGISTEKVPIKNAVGIDLGLTSLATLSDGTEISNPRWTKQEEDRLAEANRDLSRKTKGSNNRKKSKERLRRCHQRIAGKRRSYLHAVSQLLIDNYDLIAFEDLNIRSMAKSRLSKSITDASWGELIHQLKYKAEWAGKYAVAVDPRGTTQLCSGCGEKVPKKLWNREHNCPHCGLSLGRDHNAALNVLERGIRSVALAARS